jgi:ribose transport system permease protein
VLLLVYAVKLPAAFTWPSLAIIAATGLTLVLVAAGQTIVVMTGGIDLSVGGILSVATVIGAKQFTESTGTIVLWIVIIVALGAIAGSLNALLCIKLGLQPFIATLGTWSLFAGIALWIQPVEGGVIPSRLLGWTNATIGPVGMPIVGIGVVVLVWLLVRRSRLVYSLRAVGSSAQAARLSSVNVNRTLLIAYTLSAALAALAGIFLSTQIASGSPIVGNEFILQSVGAVVIGGASLRGGHGSVAATTAGAYVLTLVPSVVTAYGFSGDVGTIVQALILLFAVVVVVRGPVMRAQLKGGIE